MKKMFKVFFASLVAVALIAAVGCGSKGAGSGSTAVSVTKNMVLKYGHPNEASSVPGKQAVFFADLVAKKTEGRVKIEVFPSGQLGNLKEITEGVKLGTIPMSHNTMAAIGSLLPEIAALDTPYLFKDVDHMLKVTDVNSAVMKKLNEKLVQTNGVRMLYSFYFGTRQLTADRAIKTPADLKGVKIRSIPWELYTAAVEGMGATPIPIDFAELPTALATGVVNGQENPLDIINAARLYEMQKFLMLTSHIIASEGVIINEDTWKKISADDQKKILEATEEARANALKWNREVESTVLEDLKKKGITVIGPENGLDVNAFKASITKVIDQKFGQKYKEVFDEIKKIQ